MPENTTKIHAWVLDFCVGNLVCHYLLLSVLCKFVHWHFFSKRGHMQWVMQLVCNTAGPKLLHQSKTITIKNAPYAGTWHVGYVLTFLISHCRSNAVMAKSDCTVYSFLVIFNSQHFTNKQCFVGSCGNLACLRNKLRKLTSRYHSN